MYPYLVTSLLFGEFFRFWLTLSILARGERIDLLHPIKVTTELSSVSDGLPRLVLWCITSSPHHPGYTTDILMSTFGLVIA
jgi:hypothetical protein